MQYTGIFSHVLLMEGENTDTIGVLSFHTRWGAPSGAVEPWMFNVGSLPTS